MKEKDMVENDKKKQIQTEHSFWLKRKSKTDENQMKTHVRQKILRCKIKKYEKRIQINDTNARIFT